MLCFLPPTLHSKLGTSEAAAAAADKADAADVQARLDAASKLCVYVYVCVRVSKAAHINWFGQNHTVWFLYIDSGRNLFKCAVILRVP